MSEAQTNIRRIASITDLDFVFKQIEDGGNIDLSGYTVKFGTGKKRAKSKLLKSLKVFKEKGTDCVHCGTKGKYFSLFFDYDATRYQLKLYGINQDGVHVNMTRDHIVPKALGGSNTMDNFQTMCNICNNTIKNDDLECDVKVQYSLVELRKQIMNQNEDGGPKAAFSAAHKAFMKARYESGMDNPAYVADVDEYLAVFDAWILDNLNTNIEKNHAKIVTPA